MRYIIDRFEGNFAVCENMENDGIKNIERELIPSFVREGDVIYFESGKYLFDEKKTSERLNLINKKFDSLWE